MSAETGEEEALRLLLAGDRPEAYDHKWHGTKKDIELFYRVWKDSGTMKLYVYMGEPSGSWRQGHPDDGEEPASYHKLAARWPATMPMTDTFVPEIIKLWWYRPEVPVEAHEFMEDALEAVMAEALDDDKRWCAERARKLAIALENPGKYQPTT